MLIRTVVRLLVIAAIVAGLVAGARAFDRWELNLFILGAIGFIVLAVASWLDRGGSRR